VRTTSRLCTLTTTPDKSNEAAEKAGVREPSAPKNHSPSPVSAKCTATDTMSSTSTLASASGWYAIEALTIDPPETIEQGGTLAVRGEVFSPDDRTPVVLVGIVRADGTPVYGVASDMEDAPPVRIGTGRYAFLLSFPNVALLPGRYKVRAHALDPEGVRLFDHVEQTITVTGATRELGLVRLPHQWQTPA